MGGIEEDIGVAAAVLFALALVAEGCMFWKWKSRKAVVTDSSKPKNGVSYPHPSSARLPLTFDLVCTNIDIPP